MKWSDDVDQVIAGDLVAAFAYLTPAGGAVAIPVSPLGLRDRETGSIALTTSLAFHGKLARLLREPRVAMAYHTRDHGFSAGSAFVLAQGDAAVSVTPSPERLTVVNPAIERFLGPSPSGAFWDWMLREYFEQRVVIDIAVRRTTSWPTIEAGGTATVDGEPWPGSPPGSQTPPKNGVAPRVDTARVARRAGKLAHQLLAYRGGDGRPVIVPVEVTGHSEQGLHLRAAEGLLPAGARRAGLTAHSFGPQATSLANLLCTGWLEVSNRTAIYAPHTTGGFTTPANKSVQMLMNGLLSKQRLRRARRDGTLDGLAQLQDEQRNRPRLSGPAK
jgi:hypothetical protein